MDEKNLKKYHETINATWQLMKTHYPPSGIHDDDYWTKLILDADTLTKQHGGSKFAGELVGAVIAEMKRRSEENENQK